MHDTSAVYPPATAEIASQRMLLSPDASAAFQGFSRAVFADGVLSKRMKQIVAVAVAHVTQCPYCIRSHTRSALREGASPAELMEAMWVAAEMRAGAAYAHSTIALDVIAREKGAAQGMSTE